MPNEKAGSDFSAQLSPQVTQILPIPRCRDTLASRVRPGLIRTRGNALLAQLAHMPVLLVDHIPEPNGVIRIKIAALERLRIKEPVAEDQCSLRRLRFKSVHHHVIRMQT